MKPIQTSTWQTIAGIVLAIICWPLVLLIITYLYLLFSIIRHDNLNDPYFLYGTSLFAAGGAGYAAIAINNQLLPKANLKIIFWCFSSVILLYSPILPLGIIAFTDDLTYVWTEQVFTFIQGLVTIFSALICLRKIEKERKDWEETFQKMMNHLNG